MAKEKHDPIMRGDEVLYPCSICRRKFTNLNSRENCDRYHSCAAWLRWFEYEWRKIRREFGKDGGKG